MMRNPNLALLALGCLLGLLAVAPPAQAVEIHLTLDEDGMTAAGVVPGSTVAFFGAWRYRHPYWIESGLMDERATDDDGDGIVTWEWTWEEGRELPYAGVFVAVDLGPGGYSVATPPSFELRDLPLSGLGLALDGSGLEVEARSLLLLTVRPGVDAWIGRPKDGGASDAGAAGTDGRILLEPTPLKSRHGGGTAPPLWAVGAQLFGIDTDTLRFFAVEVP